MSENNKSKSEFIKTKFHTIRVNEQIYYYLKKLEKKTNLSKQTILLNALSMYRAFLTSKQRFVVSQDKLDKAVWYIIKLSYAVFSFREKPKENYQNLIEIINQVEQRLNIDLSLLKKVALEYLNASQITNELKIEITNALKLSLIDILENVLSGEGDNHD
jgi:DNA-directed RNA polymerase beta' subunit